MHSLSFRSIAARRLPTLCLLLPLVLSAVPAQAQTSFGPEQVISTSPAVTGAVSVFAIDLDGDGDVDVLSAGYFGLTVAWHENDGSGAFTEHVIDEVGNTTAVFATDVDGDGDVDVLATRSTSHTVFWYENDGDEAFTKRVVTDAADNVEAIFATDVDGDGDTDVLSASLSDDEIAWHENDGDEAFTKHVISTSADWALSVFATDVDGDGDVDVLSASRLDDKIAWYENDGNETFTERVISTSANEAQSVFATDVDGDGDIDVLAAAELGNPFFGGKVAWYENDGSEAFTEHVISDSAHLAAFVFATDLDGDGDTDVLSASSVEGQVEDKVMWYENDGSEAFTERIISDSAFTPEAGFAADLDGDGDTDVLLASFYRDTSYTGGKIAWYENLGPRPSFRLSARPADPPDAVPPLEAAAGSAVTFGYTVTNTTGTAVSGDLYFVAERAGNAVARGRIASGTLQGNGSFSGSYTQNVPSAAPPGVYTYTLSIGRFSTLSAADSEIFTVVVTSPDQPGLRSAGEPWAVSDAAPWPAESAADAPGAQSRATAVPVAAYPNPFASTATLGFSLAEGGTVRIAVYDLLGREVARPVDGTVTAGEHTVQLDGTRLPAGSYVVRFEGDGRVETQHVTLVR